MSQGSHPPERGVAADLTVVDFGHGMAAALIAKQFADFGARVVRVAAAEDPFDAVYPAHRAWRRDAIAVGEDEAEALLAGADLCILGGADLPGIARRRDAAALVARHPRLIVLDITGYPDRDGADRPAVDLLVQARTGAVYEQYAARPNAAPVPLPSYGAALQGLVGAWVALVERERSGRGQSVAVSLAAGAAMFWAPFWMKAERPNAGFAAITPLDVRHLILQCRDGDYLQLTLGVAGALARIHRVLGIEAPTDTNDRGMPDLSRGPDKFFGDAALFEHRSRTWGRADLLAALAAAGVPAEAVLSPGEAWDDAQTRINGIVVPDADGGERIGSPITAAGAGAPAPVPERLRTLAPGEPPLAGVRVVDFGIFVAGPYASKLLADYGAEVILVEPPSGRATLSGERTIIAANHGKDAIRIDAKSEGGRVVIERLCARADIVLHNFRPGVAARLGLDGETLRRFAPGLVTLETTAYGPVGPKAALPGFDMVMQAHSGLEVRAGGDGNAPICNRSPIVDFATGALGAIGLLAGLFERLRSGRPVSAHTNLLNTSLHVMAELVRLPDGRFAGAPPLDRGQTGSRPAESLYRARDGWFAIAIVSAAMATALGEALGIALPPSPDRWGEAERAAIAAAVATRDRDALLDMLDAAGIWAEACRRDAWAIGCPPDGIMRRMTDPVFGEVTHCIGPLVRFSRSTTRPGARLSTDPGADTDAILSRLGVTGADAGTLFVTGAVR